MHRNHIFKNGDYSSLKWTSNQKLKDREGNADEKEGTKY